MNDSKEIFGLIKSLVNERNISLSDFGKRIGLSRTSMSRYRHGERNFKLNNVTDAARVLEVSPEYLLGIPSEYEVRQLRDENKGLKEKLDLIVKLAND